jgi:hypothetical protein
MKLEVSKTRVTDDAHLLFKQALAPGVHAKKLKTQTFVVSGVCVCVCVFVYAYVHMYAYIYICIYTHMCVCVCIYIR